LQQRPLAVCLSKPLTPVQRSFSMMATAGSLIMNSRVSVLLTAAGGKVLPLACKEGAQAAIGCRYGFSSDKFAVIN